MNKAANIYSTNRYSSASPRRAIRRKPPVRPTHRNSPWWLSLIIVGSIFAMLCISINLRAFSSTRAEIEQHTRLSTEIQNLIDENLALQEEIHMIKTNPAVIKREANKIGVVLENHKFPVQTN